MKSDNSIYNICIAAIKRSTMKPYDKNKNPKVKTLGFKFI